MNGGEQNGLSLALRNFVQDVQRKCTRLFFFLATDGKTLGVRVKMKCFSVQLKSSQLFQSTSARHKRPAIDAVPVEKNACVFGR